MGSNTSVRIGLSPETKEFIWSHGKNIYSIWSETQVGVDKVLMGWELLEVNFWGLPWWHSG